VRQNSSIAAKPNTTGNNRRRGPRKEIQESRRSHRLLRSQTGGTAGLESGVPTNKEEAMTRRFAAKIQAALTRTKVRCEKQARDSIKVKRDIGRMPGRNSRAARMFNVKVIRIEKRAARIEWSKVEAAADWGIRGMGNLADRKGVPNRIALEFGF
jgi:hypothetical protein